MKAVKSKDYNYIFNEDNGYFIRWGKSPKDDPQMSPFGPEIIDMEISTICHGPTGTPCAFCYKANTSRGYNMTLEQFKELFVKFPKNLTQIAFGIGDIDSNPDMFKIFEYSRSQGVIPNVTTNGRGIDKKTANALANVCGAVAVSRYQPKDICYNAVKKLTDTGMKQVNIHMLVCEQTFNQCMELLDDAKNDERLSKLNAIVFLTGKQKGRGTWLKSLPIVKYKQLIDYAFDNEVRIGFDSCSANKFIKAVEGRRDSKRLSIYAEPCESGLFSAYINVHGIYYPCSFTEGEKEIKGIDLFKINDFMKEVWNSQEVNDWRKKLLGNCRNCPIFAI